MKNKNLGDIMISAAMILLCGFFWMESSDYASDVKVFPRIFLAMLAVTSFITLIKAIRGFQMDKKAVLAEKAAGTYEEEVFDSHGTDLKPWMLKMLPYLTLGFILLYILGIQYIGFFVSTTVFMIAFMRWMQVKKWIMMIAITIGTEAFIYILFVIVFAIRLPGGILF